MAITTKTFTDLVSNQVTAIQGAANRLVDLTIGSILRSIVEANASVHLWLQSLILQLLATTRASSSISLDLDTWVNDYGVTRLSAGSASGLVTFSRFTATQQAQVNIGASIQTLDGTQQYLVVIDTTNANYSASLNAYILLAGVPSISVPVSSVSTGVITNAQALQINTIVTAMAGIDTVVNNLTFTNGIDAESDTALRLRFVAFIAGLSKATKLAIGYAVTSLQQGAVFSITENVTYAGVAKNGYFYVVVDDGTGTPSSTFLASVTNAIEIVRPFTTTFGVYAPALVSASVTMTCTIATGYDPVATKALVSTAITNYINSLTLGAGLTYTRLAQLAYGASAGVINATAINLNALTSDLTITSGQIIKSGTIVIS